MLKPVVKTLKNLKRRVVGYRAELFGDPSYALLSAVGDTKTEAVSALRTSVIDTLSRLDRGTQILQWKGATIVVSPTPEGWSYWTSVFSRTDFHISSTPGKDTREDTLDAALSHTAKTLWNHDVNDVEFVAGLPPSVASELRSYFEWQRTYHRLVVVQGYSDDDARQILGGFLKETRP